jgi:hypothetical protein
VQHWGCCTVYSSNQHQQQCCPAGCSKYCLDVELGHGVSPALAVGWMLCCCGLASAVQCCVGSSWAMHDEAAHAHSPGLYAYTALQHAFRTAAVPDHASGPASCLAAIESIACFAGADLHELVRALSAASLLVPIHVHVCCLHSPYNCLIIILFHTPVRQLRMPPCCRRCTKPHAKP